MPIGRLSLVIVCLVVTACITDGRPVERSAPLTTTSVSTTAPRPTVPSSATTTTSAPADGDICVAPAARAGPDAHRPSYRLEITADPETGEVTGDQVVLFTPDLPVDTVVFRLWANGPRPASVGSHITITAVTENGVSRPVETPDPTTAVVGLGRTVDPGQRIRLRLAWELQVNGPVNDRISRQSGSLRLGSFVPLLAWQPGLGWATEPPTSGFAEAATSPTADWRYSVQVPEGFDVIGSGLAIGDGTFVAELVRDIAVSVGRFSVLTAIAAAPEPVSVLVAVHDGVDDPARYLDQIVRHLQDLAARYGPYPWDSYAVSITPDLLGGIEFPMHVMQGPGTEDRTTVHEVAHMWFYGLVGNNQALHPYLDEGLATYAEGSVLGTLDSMAARRIPGDGLGHAAEAMTYWESRAGSYYSSVYVQTAAALHRLGAPELVDCALARYVAENAFAIAEPRDLAAALAEVFAEWRPALAGAGLP